MSIELAVGTKIDIKRTDGRVHSAVVSRIDNDNRCTTVEWYEHGEAKGKEVDFEALFSLNQHIVLPKKTAVETSPMQKPDSRLPLRGLNPVRASMDLKESYDSPAKKEIKRKEATPKLAEEQHAYDNNQNIRAAQVKNVPAAPAQVKTVPAAGAIPQVKNIPVAPAQVKPPPVVAPAPVAAAPVAVAVEVSADNLAKERKSNTVKEIEAIQQRREERRAAQQKARIFNAADIDPSNPNFEILKMIREYQTKLDFQPLSALDDVPEQQICVCVRKRPMNRKEMSRKDIDVITVPSKEFLVVHEPRVKVDLTKYLEHQHFRFDYAFDETADNSLVYWYTARPLVQCIFERGMATCFAYGQTGSGKTHTMGGEFHARGAQNCRDGIYALAARDVFHLLDTKYAAEDFNVEAAFFEIYGGKVFDLLNEKTKLRMLEDASGTVQIVGLRTQTVCSVDEVLSLLENGTHIRTSGQTSANQHSSRSHAVFQIMLFKENKLHGKFSLIDLAGNERGADTSSSDRVTRLEGAEINKSLLALKECIRALGRKGAHLPFRASKLTQVLRDSFTGDRSRTCMIAMISPSKESCEHTLNTLRYADRVKELGPNGDGKTIDDWKQPVSSNRNQGAVCTQQQFAPTTSRANTQLGKMPKQPKLAEQVVAEEDDDIALLCDDDDAEMSEEVIKFHRTHKKAEELEEEICEQHKDLLQKMGTWHGEHKKLGQLINRPGYDTDNVIATGSALLETQISFLTQLRDKFTLWSKHVNQEDELLTRMNHVSRRK